MTFSGHPEVVPIRTQKLPQTIETPVTFAAVPNAYVRFAYSRSSDSMANQIEGQDYLCFRHNDQRLVFVVADGVGSSFCGNLAARILGDNLLDWYWSLDIAYLGGAAALSEAATSFLNRLQKTAQLEVQEYEISDAIPPLIRQALEAQRAYGSEAIFAACRIDHPSPMIPDGMISLFWMGDTQIHVLDEDGGPIDVGGAWENANRWSTAQGVRGRMSAWMQPLGETGRVTAFTDGLSHHGEKVLTYPDAKLDREIYLGAKLPTSDDVAFVDVVLRTPRYEGYPEPDMPDPNLERPHLEPIWNPTGAETYELRWGWPGNGGRISFMIQEATNPALTDARTFSVAQGTLNWKPDKAQPPGHYYYRVRAVKRFGGLTPWSELRQAKVSYPPPPAPTLFPVEPEKAAVLHWEGEGEALEYLLEQAVDDTFEEPETVYEGRGTAWAIPTNRPGTYFFRVKAISDGGPGPWSDSQEVSITLPAPPVPSLGTVSYGYTHGEYTLRWQPVPRATHYELAKFDKDDPGADPDIVELEETTYQVEEEPVGNYVYRVRACHEHGCSAWSNEQMVVITPVPPAGPPELTLTGPDADGLIALEWSEIEDALEYLCEVSDDPSFENARVFTQTHRTLELKRREPGAAYFRVCAVNAGGDGPWSDPITLAIAPPTPDWIEAELTENDKHARVTWAAVGGRAAYRLEAGFGEPPDFEKLYQGDMVQFEAPVAALPPGNGALRFRVRAELPGIESGWTTSRALTLADRPQQAGLRPTIEPPEIAENGEIRVRWNAVKGATNYRLEVARDKDFADFRTTEVPTNGANFRPSTSGGYWFRVWPLAPGGDLLGQPSEAVSIRVQHPAAPKLWPVDPVRPGAEYEIAWQGVPDCDHYELQESRSRDFEKRQTRAMRVFHPSQKMLMPAQKPGTLYYRVMAVDKNRQASPWSETLVVEIQ